MIKERFELENQLDNFISQYNINKKVFNPIKEEMVNRGISLGLFQDIWSKRVSLASINMPSLYLFTKFFYEKTGEALISPKLYFTETEIRDGDNYKKEVFEEEKLEFPLLFENAIEKPNSKDHYVFFLTGKQLKRLKDSQKISYNFDAQRNPKYIKGVDGDLIKVANINATSVKEITKDIISDDFQTNIITLNLLQDGTDELIYNDKKKELIIKSGQINIIDGMHRLQGIDEALVNDPSNTYVTEIRFLNFDIYRCRLFINQENKRNEINKRYLESIMNVDDRGNQVVTKLNSGSGDLKGKIVTDPIHIKNHKALTMFDFMSESIKLLYKFKSNMDVSKTSEWLKDFFDYVIGYKSDEFISEIEKTKEISVINMPATFIGYLALSAKLYEDKEWEEKLTEILDSVDWYNNNPVWEELNICRHIITENKDEYVPTTKLNKSDFNKIINYFNQLLEKR